MAEAADDENFFSIMKNSLIDALEQDTLSEQDKLGIHSLWDEAQRSNS
ncbi:MAG: hypothetical protein OFPII_00440 [Osedax symbiont Rs1]|nr:MAG: hypothetical protein OFPII_00440 [Osedax symbiont Rs1]